MGSRFNIGTSAIIEKPKSKEMLGCRVGSFQGPSETSGVINIPRGLIKGVQIVQVAEGDPP